MKLTDLTQETANNATAAQRVLSTSAGQSLSPGAQAELRALAAAAKGSSADESAHGGQPRPSHATAVAAAALSGAVEAGGSPHQSARCSARSQTLPAPGLPPVRWSAAAAGTAAARAPATCITSAALVEHLTSSSAHSAAVNDSADAPGDAPMDTAQLRGGAASQGVERGSPAVRAEARRETRRKLAFQPAAADIAEGGGAREGGWLMGRTVAVASDLATLATDSSAPVRTRRFWSPFACLK